MCVYYYYYGILQIYVGIQNYKESQNTCNLTSMIINSESILFYP